MAASYSAVALGISSGLFFFPARRPFPRLVFGVEYVVVRIGISLSRFPSLESLAW